jgi:hypothetical protein
MKYAFDFKSLQQRLVVLLILPVALFLIGAGKPYAPGNQPAYRFDPTVVVQRSFRIVLKGIHDPTNLYVIGDLLG